LENNGQTQKVEHTRKSEKVTVVSVKQLPIHRPAIKSKNEGNVVILHFFTKEKNEERELSSERVQSDKIKWKFRSTVEFQQDVTTASQSTEKNQVKHEKYYLGDTNWDARDAHNHRHG
jgi:hypothetical protein